MTEVDESQGRHRSARRTWWTTFVLAVLGLFGAAAPWAYNTPIGSYPDECYHAYYAREPS